MGAGRLEPANFRDMPIQSDNDTMSIVTFIGPGRNPTSKSRAKKKHIVTTSEFYRNLGGCIDPFNPNVPAPEDHFLTIRR